MIDWRRTIVGPEASVRDALTALDRGQAKIALVCDAGDRLLGTVTDGDVRRALIAGRDLGVPVADIMHRQPAFATPAATRDEILARMRALDIDQMPVVDGHGRVIGLHVLHDFDRKPVRPNRVVLMAGGEGRRLRPLTENMPKPMLPVGGRPILETILSAFIDQGFGHFYISVNYRGDLIREHFGDGSRWGAHIDYLDESEPLGTAGALSLLPEKPREPVFVMNADLLTRVNFEAMLDYHVTAGAAATMCVREYGVEVPFGVVEFSGDRITRLVEKPTNTFFINAGIYLLSPEAVARVPAGASYHMTTLFHDLIAEGAPCVSFPVHEYWLDIGRVSDFERAHRDFETNFGAIKGGGR
ncbi:MAG: nucleotidyltransferase family protein [Proteobacteria bacterium]|nr:nucleotidyltransferase family protein [Pseudomonadota bacterium]